MEKKITIKELKAMAVKMGLVFAGNASEKKVQELVDARLAEINAELLEGNEETVPEVESVPEVEEEAEVEEKSAPEERVFPGVHPITGESV